MAKYALSKYFGGGGHHVIRYPDSELLLFSLHGRPNGTARYIEHVKRYARNGIEHKSLAALLRAVAAEQKGA